MSEVKIYCETCDKHQPLDIDEMSTDDLNDNIWGDLVCSKCRFVIATLSVPVAGVYDFTLLSSLAKK